MWKSSKLFVTCACVGFLSTTAVGGGSPLTRIGFEERATEAGLEFYQTLVVNHPMALMGTGGVAGDFNNDGWCDVFVIGGGASHDALFINQGLGADGRVHFAEVSEQWGVRALHLGVGGSAADYDGDGDLDLYVTSYGDPDLSELIGHHRLYRNDLQSDGSRVFVDVAEQAGVHQLLSTSPQGLGSAWGDVDRDGDLDLYVTGYNAVILSSRLFRNNSNGTFTDITRQAGIDQLGLAGLVPGVVDMFGDGWPDLLLVADTGTSRFYDNQGLDENGFPIFVDRTSTVIGLESANGMGSAVGDIDKDGRLDWYVSSIYWDFLDGPGNLLLMQKEDTSFKNVATGKGIDDGQWGWGVVMADFDHDRDLDLGEVNGWTGTFSDIPPFLHEQTAPMLFTEVHAESGFDVPSEGRGLVNADFDNDGDQDMIVFNLGGWLNYYENTLLTPGQPVPSDANWLRIGLDTSARDRLPPDGVHASLVVSAGGEQQLLCIDGGFNHCSQGEIDAHVGLGDAITADWIRVNWPDGTKTTLENVDANQILTISATAFAADLNNDGILDLGDIQTLIGLYLSGSLSADINGDSILDQADLTRFVHLFLNRL